MGTLTVASIQQNLAYRLGETAAPSDNSTKALRLEWINMAYFDMSRKRNWWWLEAAHSTNTNTGSTTGYAEPADLKEFIELKINTYYYKQVPYKSHQITENTLGVVQLPSLRQVFQYYRFAGRYYLIPADGADAAVHYIKYYKRVAKLTSDADTFLIPDEYTEGLSAYAEARYWMSISQQAKAAAPFQEYEQIVSDMGKEQGRRGWGNSGFAIRDPEAVVY